MTQRTPADPSKAARPDPFLERLAQLEREAQITPQQREQRAAEHGQTERQRALFLRDRSSLLERYADQYIAFQDGEVLDSDPSSRALALRMFARYGQQLPLIVRVEATDTVVEMGTLF